MLPDVHYVDLDIRFNPFRPHVFYARDLLGEEPGGLYMGEWGCAGGRSKLFYYSRSEATLGVK